MQVTGLVEHDSVPWEALPGLMVVDDRGEWRLRGQPQGVAPGRTPPAGQRPPRPRPPPTRGRARAHR